MKPSTVFAACLAIACVNSTATTGPIGVKLSADDKAVFCGVDGHEVGPSYGRTVNAEVTWRMAAGARTPAEALAKMRQEYCLAPGGAK